MEVCCSGGVHRIPYPWLQIDFWFATTALMDGWEDG